MLNLCLMHLISRDTLIGGFEFCEELGLSMYKDVGNN